MTMPDFNTATKEDVVEQYRQLFLRAVWLEKQVFGPKSEKSKHVNELQIDLNLGVDPAPITEEVRSTPVVGHSRTVSNKPKSYIPDNLPILSEETICPDVDLTRCDCIGVETTNKLERIPAKIGWHRIHRPKFRDRINGEISIADLPPHCNEKGLAGASVLSSVYTNKFQFHQPLYRQAQSIRQETGISFAESTLCDMVAKTHFWLEAIATRIGEVILAQTYIQADESRIPVLTKGNKGKVHSGFEWVLYSPLMRAALFRYAPGRAQKYADELLKTYKGRIQTDDYVGYNNVHARKDITPIACMAHARRYFVNAIDHPKLSAIAILFFKELYAVEEEARTNKITHEGRTDLRQEKSVPIMGRFREFLDNNRVGLLPASKIAKAFDYTLNNWQRLNVYLSDGEVEIDNNLIENSIRPLALGRKNWMFAGSPKGAEWASVAYSIIATAKLHGLDPYEYICVLLKELPKTKSTDLDRFLPWNFGKSV